MIVRANIHLEDGSRYSVEQYPNKKNKKGFDRIKIQDKDEVSSANIYLDSQEQAQDLINAIKGSRFYKNQDTSHAQIYDILYAEHLNQEEKLDEIEQVIFNQSVAPLKRGEE